MYFLSALVTVMSILTFAMCNQLLLDSKNNTNKGQCSLGVSISGKLSNI